MIQVLIPMAGNGQRFRDAGYLNPKPFIDVAGIPMIDRVMECLTPAEGAHFTLISRFPVLGRDNVDTVELLTPTGGAVETLYRARDRVTDAPLMVANCDQLITDGMIDKFLDDVTGYDAGIITFNSTNPHHSYVTGNPSGIVWDIAEKKVISDNALAGIYWFRSGTELMGYAKSVIDHIIRVNGEYYVSSVLAMMIRDGLAVKAWEIDVHDKHMLGTPEELQIFLDKVDTGRVVL